MSVSSEGLERDGTAWSSKAVVKLRLRERREKESEAKEKGKKQVKEQYTWAQDKRKRKKQEEVSLQISGKRVDSGRVTKEAWRRVRVTHTKKSTNKECLTFLKTVARARGRMKEWRSVSLWIKTEGKRQWMPKRGPREMDSSAQWVLKSEWKSERSEEEEREESETLPLRQRAERNERGRQSGTLLLTQQNKEKRCIMGVWALHRHWRHAG